MTRDTTKKLFCRPVIARTSSLSSNCRRSTAAFSFPLSVSHTVASRRPRVAASSVPSRYYPPPSTFAAPSLAAFSFPLYMLCHSPPPSSPPPGCRLSSQYDNRSRRRPCMGLCGLPNLQRPSATPMSSPHLSLYPPIRRTHKQHLELHEAPRCYTRYVIGQPPL
jgi:hypothetical protein